MTSTPSARGASALCYNWGFFTVLGYAPFPMDLSPIRLGLVFTGWGIFVATAAEGEDLTDARTVVRNQLDLLAAHRVPAQGQVLRHASGHGMAGRMVAEYANAIGASTIVIGPPSHGGCPR